MHAGAVEMVSRRSDGGETLAVLSSPQLDIAALYRAHRLQLVRLAILLVDDQASAEDVVHDAFINLHRRGGQLRDPQAALGYLRTSVVNGSRSVLRRRQTTRRHLQRVTEDWAPAADRGALQAAEQSRVLDALRRLPKRQREVLTLRYWSDLSEADIASALGISRGSVKSAASRGIRQLERLLGESR